MQTPRPTLPDTEYIVTSDGTMDGTTVAAKDGYVLPGLSGFALSVGAEPVDPAVLSMVLKAKFIYLKVETDEGTYQIFSDKDRGHPIEAYDVTVLRPDGQEMHVHAADFKAEGGGDVRVTLHTGMVEADVALQSEQGQALRLALGHQRRDALLQGLDEPYSWLRYGVGPKSTLLQWGNPEVWLAHGEVEVPAKS